MIFTRIGARLLAAALCVVVVTGWARADLQEKLHTILEEEGLTGISWATVTPEDGVRTGAYGLQDVKSGTPFAGTTRVHVGSVTKTLLATGVLRLVHEGKLDLYAPVREYLPDLRIDNPWHDTSPIRLRHLLDHTAGLNDAYLWQMFTEKATPDTPLADAFIRSSAALAARSRPGTRLSYSNMGYTLLGLIIERVTGERYETYLDRELLTPLGMADSSFGFATQKPGMPGYDTRLAWGHFERGGQAEALPIYLRPAGQFVTTPADMARFMRFLMGNGSLGGTSFIAPELMQGRGKPAGTEAAASGLEAGYALGLGRRDRFGTIGYCHSGNIIGYVAMMCVYPGQDKAFFYSINTDSETADYSRAEEAFVSHLAPAPASKPATDLMAPDIRDWEGVYALAPNRFQSFEMLDLMAGSMTATLEQETFVLRPFQGKDRILRGTGGYLFSADDRSTNSHIFMLDEHGRLLISDGFRTYKKTSPAILYGHWLSLILAGLGLLWILGTMVTVLIRHGGKARSHVLCLPFVATLALVVPVPLFLMQPFTALGDFTLASAVLAIVSLSLPLAVSIGLFRIIREKDRTRLTTVHAMACFAVLQFCGLMFYHGLIPIMTWTL